MNLPMLAESLPAIFGWPAGVEGHYDGPVLWLCGDRSEYVRAEHEAPMRELFPGTRRVDLPAGHWVHADAPIRPSRCCGSSSRRPDRRPRSAGDHVDDGGREVRQPAAAICGITAVLAALGDVADDRH